MISISQFTVTAVNPSTAFFENQGPSFYLADYTRPRLSVTVSSSSDIVKYEYYGTLFGNTSTNPYTAENSVYVGPVVQATGSNLSVTVKVTNADNEVATTSVSGLNVLEYTIPVIGNIDYVFGDWVQSPSGYSWNDNPYGNSIKVTAQISICLDGSNGDQPALNPPNTCVTQFLINDWVIVSANNYQSGEPEIVAVLSDVVSGQDMILSVRVKDSVSGWVRKNIDILGSSGIVVDDELSSTSTNPVQNRIITNALSSTGQAADTALSPTSTNPVQNKVITAAINGLNNSLNGLGNLAHSNTVSASYTPSGSVGWLNTVSEEIEAPKFTGVATTINLSGSIDNGSVVISTASGTSNYTPSGNVTANFSGTQGSVSVSGTPSGVIKVFANSTEKEYTPAGSISTPTFTGNQATLSVSGTPSGTINALTFNGTSETLSVSGVPTGTVTIASSTSGTKNYTPAGSITVNTGSGSSAYTPSGAVSASFVGDNKAVSVTGTPSGSVSVTTNTASVSGISSVGTLPNLRAEYNSATEDLSFSWATGNLPTTVNKTFVTKINTATFSGNSLTSTGYYTSTGNVTASFSGNSSTFSSTFNGTATNISASFNGSSLTSTGTYAPKGNISQPVFSGNTMTSTGNYTPTGNISTPTFSGTKVNLTATFNGNSLTSTGTFTPSGAITNVTFSGTGVNLVGSVAGGNISSSMSYTPQGTISNITFVGNTSTIVSSPN